MVIVYECTVVEHSRARIDDRLLLSIIPVMENIASTGTLVAEIDK